MGVPRQHRVAVALARGNQDALQVANLAVQCGNRASQVEPLIHIDLIVAATPSVQLAANRADQLGQPLLHRHVDVFKRVGEVAVRG